MITWKSIILMRGRVLAMPSSHYFAQMVEAPTARRMAAAVRYAVSHRLEFPFPRFECDLFLTTSGRFLLYGLKRQTAIDQATGRTGARALPSEMNFHVPSLAIRSTQSSSKALL
jgi:hypothetical protein